jgi:tetratricopeptide (TPR) repeat protein
MAELRISDVPAGAGGSRRVRVSWQVGTARREAEAVFAAPSDARDGERVRWYLEEYAEFPADPGPVLAAEAEAQLAQTGADLFDRVFADRDAVGIWEQARDRLSEVRVEVDTDPGEGPGLAWELLRDPGTGAAVALGAGSFVRTHLRAAGHPELPEPAGDRLRVLLVIARPGGRDDVPFRSVASRLVRGGADQMRGLDLDVLRPATFARLSQVLHEAKAAGRPYHVVHFDGHGTYVDLSDLDLAPESNEGTGAASLGTHGGGGVRVSPLRYGISVAGPVQAGQHGYLLFEDPATKENQCLVDGLALGRLLVGAGVPVLVLNACRSAYTDAVESAGEPGDGEQVTPAREGVEGVLTGDVHARIRAYGSLAAEIADAGVPGVVAMRYNVYVVTAAQFVADLYAHLLAGKPLGQAVAAARKALAADPMRQIGPVPVSLQDWAVPVIYESAPLALLRPPDRTAPLIKVTSAETKTDKDSAAGGVPRPPDAGFFGRDETLLALDRAFDTQPVVLLHAFAGSGKTTTAAEFARWYAATGGLDWAEQPEWPGAVLWSSFEHHLTADRVIGTAGDFFAPLLEASDIPWAAVTDPGERRDIVLQVLAQVPVLWVWDNVEPVSGFPEGADSDWDQAEQDDLAELLRDLAQQTRCKVLVTSRRNEHHWLGNLPARVQLPPMPLRESLQLAVALAGRHGGSVARADWRPLLRYAGGNPLTVTVVVGQALREGITTTEDIGAFVARLQAGEAELEAGQDAELGRSRSLAASLSYGFAEAFTSGQERAQLAALHLFRDGVNAAVLSVLGDPEIAEKDAVPALASLAPDAVAGLLDRAAGIGLLESLGQGTGYYRIHPALPWYFTGLFIEIFGPPGAPAAQTVARAYARAMGELGEYYLREAEAGRAADVVVALGIEEGNLRHALGLAQEAGLWRVAVGCLQGLSVLYSRTGRDGEWARLIEVFTPNVTDPGTGGPLPGREDQWSVVTSHRMQVAYRARDWPAATILQTALIDWDRDRAAAAMAVPADSLTPAQRNQIRNLAASLNQLGTLLQAQDSPDCLPPLQESVMLTQRIGDRAAEATATAALGNAYLYLPKLRDLGQAERWYRHSLKLSADDQASRAMTLDALGTVAWQRFEDARSAGEPEPVLLGHLNAALDRYRQALDLTPANNHGNRAVTENQLGNLYVRAGDVSQAMDHYQRSIQHEEAQGNIYGAGQTRFNIAILLAENGRVSDALLYARAALRNFREAGPGAAAAAADAERLIARLEQQNH